MVQPLACPCPKPVEAAVLRPRLIPRVRFSISFVEVRPNTDDRQQAHPVIGRLVATQTGGRRSCSAVDLFRAVAWARAVAG